MNDAYLKKLVIERLRTMPPNVSFSIGSHGDFTRDQLIQEVQDGSDVGLETVESELRLLREMPHLVSRLQTE